MQPAARRPIAALAVLLAALQVAAYPCSPTQLGDCPTPPGGLRADQVPQFITITWDDAISPYSYDLVQKIVGGFTQRNGCPVPSTYFISTTDTIPAAVQALYLQGSEVATHTMSHVGNPPAAEIVGARAWLANATGIPESRIVGFRAPFLLHNPETRQTLADNGFLYDSSIADNLPSKISPSVGERAWPYQMDGGIPQDCTTGSCTADEKYAGLWEIPLQPVGDAAQKPIAAMDPTGNAFDNFKRELDWRLAGNRAPLGMLFHAGLQSEPGRVAELRQFIEHALQQPDVWFVTNQQLLAWMQNPVPASRLASQLKCHRPTDISPHVGPVCDTYVGDCKFGSFDAATCRCKCMGEGTPGGYCRDEATGQCTATC